MRRTMFSVNSIAFLSYLLVIAVMYLASTYLGGLFRYLFAVTVLLPILSILHLLVVHTGVRIDQRFADTDPARGETIAYSAWIDNTSFLPAPRITVRLTLFYPGADLVEQDVALALASRDGYEYRTTVVCAHRGDYTLGLESCRVTDLLGWMTLRRSLDRRTFTVYPRVVAAHFASVPGREGAGVGRTQSLGREVDPTLLRGLAEYRRNEPIKHIAWRKFAAHGVPYLKEYDSGQRPATVIYLDMREIRSERSLDAEDCSVEILVAVVKSLVDAEIPVEVHGQGTHRYETRVTTRSQFREFYLSTRRIGFGGEWSPGALIAAHAHRRSDRPEVALVITHRIDDTVTAVFSRTGQVQASGIINMVALSGPEKQSARQLAYQARMEGCSINLVEHNEQIVEGLMA